VFLVERVAGEAFVLLGTTAPQPPGGTPRIVGGDDDEVWLAVVAASFEVPPLTVLGTGACTTEGAEPVLVRRVLDPATEEAYGDPTLHDAVRVDDACAPILAIEGRQPQARLVALEFEDVPFGEPIPGHAAGGWTAELDAPPGDDICPGFPIVVTVTPPSGVPRVTEAWSLVVQVLVLENVAQFWTLTRTLTQYAIAGPLAEPVWRTYPTGVDFAEECL
jgi:hypothetical protein